MKLHTTNYFDTFIEVADDCPTETGEIPKSKGENKTIAELQFELLIQNPYKFTSDDIFFLIYADRNNLSSSDYKEAREQFFSKGQPCFRASPLTKRYGFGVVVRTQQEFLYEGTFGTGTLPGFTTVDAMVSYKFPKLKSLLKVGGTNIFNNYFRTGFGSPAVGGLYYVSFAYNVF